MLALLTRSLGKGSLKAIRYIHHTPGGASSGLYPPAENLHLGLMHVNKVAAACGSHQRLSAPKVGSGLTGLYSAFSNPFLECLGYGMANMRLISRDAGRLGQLFSLLLVRN
jgi:hypothetical protein